jgi:hypothetical protein
MAAGATYEPIATTTLGSAQSSITFTSIPGTYTDLVLVVAGTANGSGAYLRFNSDTGTNYSFTRLNGNNANVIGSYRAINQVNMEVGGIFLYQSNAILSIMNYANTTTYKTVVGRSNALQSGAANYGASVGLWRSTSAITSVTYMADINMDIGCTFTLYGIAAA